MKSALRVSLILVSLLGLGLPRALAAADTSLTAVAVLDFDATEPKLKERGAQLALLVTTRLSTMDGMATVERQELAKVLGEQEMGVSGLVDPATAARIGHLTGARVLVTGRVFTVAGETTVAVKVISTETGRVFGELEHFSMDAPPSGPADKLAVKIAGILQSKQSALIAQAVTPDDRIARLKQKLAGNKLPSVSISIPEQHVGPAIIDPAAETEIGLILGQVGFTVLGGAAAQGADFRISGEAFSEAGIRRGNLISCRARVEVKATARESGRVALVDRQVTWAVDPAEHIAAKTALQQAGAELAERLAEAIVRK